MGWNDDSSRARGEIASHRTSWAPVKPFGPSCVERRSRSTGFWETDVSRAAFTSFAGTPQRSDAHPVRRGRCDDRAIADPGVRRERIYRRQRSVGRRARPASCNGRGRSGRARCHAAGRRRLFHLPAAARGLRCANHCADGAGRGYRPDRRPRDRRRRLRDQALQLARIDRPRQGFVAPRAHPSPAIASARSASRAGGFIPPSAASSARTAPRSRRPARNSICCWPCARIPAASCRASNCST